MGERGRRKVDKCFKWNVVANRVFSVYKKI